jgi:hypothetical protein
MNPSRMLTVEPFSLRNARAGATFESGNGGVLRGQVTEIPC